MFCTSINTGFDAKAIAPILSHQIVGIVDIETPSSFISIRIQYNSAVAMERLRYSASVLLFETMGYFFAVQVIRFDLRKTP